MPPPGLGRRCCTATYVEAIALLATAYECCLALVLLDDVGDPLEACEDIIYLYAVLLSDCAHELSCNDCLHDILLSIEISLQ